MYSPQLLDHFYHPRNQAELEDASFADARYDRCGDWLRLFVRLENGRVAEACYQAVGCGAVLAVGSAGTQLILGEPVQQARQLTSQALEAALGGIPDTKRHAIEMFLGCLRQVLDSAPLIT
ncbi:MAG: iron-sulfur cluster assembly scaffold protein [Deltaproteobacteria bacterium]|nr:iron-sulfur cluster assembly scaffold protein [Deltaproteobacteria bacterium]